MRKQISDLELGWAAGILEGEGCFSYAGRKTNRTPAVQIRMSDRDILERLVDLFGGKVYDHAPRPTSISGPNPKPMYRAAWYGQKAKQIITAILPLLGERRKARALEVLAVDKKDIPTRSYVRRVYEDETAVIHVRQ